MAYNQSQFSNSNGITFGTVSNISGNVITASHNGITQQSTQPVAISGSNGSFNFSTVTFGNLNGLSFYSSNGSIVGSHNALTSQSNQAFSASGGSSAFQTLSFANSNGFTFSNSNGSIVGSYTVPTQTTQPVAISGSNGSFTFSTVSFGNSNGMSFYSTNGSIVGSYTVPNVPAQTTQPVAYSAANGSTLFSTISFANSNGVSFSSGTQGLYATVATNYIGLNTAITGGSMTANSSGISVNIPAAAPAPVYVVAGTTNGSLATINFSNSNGVSFGLNGSTITASVNAGGGGVAIAASNSTFTSGTVQFNGSGAMTIGTGAQAVNISVPAVSSISGLGGISISTNGSTINISNVAPYVSRLIFPEANQITALSAFGNGSMSIQYVPMDGYVTATRLDMLASWSAGSTTNANTIGIAMTAFAGIYTRNGSTLSSISSGSTQQTLSYASNSSNWSNINSAIRAISVPMNINITPGEYYVGFGFSTAASSIGTATTNLGQTVSAMGYLGIQSALNYAEFNAATATSNNIYSGMGIYSAALSTVPPAISLSAINMTGTALSRANINIVFRNY